MRLKFELFDCSPEPLQGDVLQECMSWARQIGDQTEKVANCGILLYLQDTSATRLSTYGTMLYKVGHSSSLTDGSYSGASICHNSEQCSTCSNESTDGVP